MATAPKCKSCGKQHWGLCPDVAQPEPASSRPVTHALQPDKPKRDAPVTQPRSRYADVTRQVVHRDGGVTVAVPCACGCGEEVSVTLDARYVDPAHKQRAYRQRKRGG